MVDLNKMTEYDSNEVPLKVSSGSLITYNFHSRLLKQFHKPVRKSSNRIPHSLSNSAVIDIESEIDLSHDSVLPKIKDESQIDILHNPRDAIKEENVTKSLSPTNDGYLATDFSDFFPLLFKPNSHLDYFSHVNLIEIKDCDSDVSSSSNIVSDVMQKEPVRDVNTPLKCGFCDYACEDLSELKIHKRLHNVEAPFYCSECSYTCRKFSNLRSHKQMHARDKLFACDKCSYTSNFVNNLKSHKIIHSGEKPFSCGECEYVCGRPSNLKRHKLKHSKDKPYSCDICTYTSKDLTGLKVHKLTHSGKKPFICDECSSSYVTLKSLNHHKKKHTLKLTSETS